MIAHNKPTLGKEEESAASQVIRSNWLAQGEEVELFENDICDFLHIPKHHAVAVSSGTAALYLALWALEAKTKKIALPAYTCSSLRHAVAMAGGEEVILDTKKNNPNIDVKELDENKTPIAIVQHTFGIPNDISNINSNIQIIEDCAQALGAKMNNQFVGIKGDVGIFSFYATKLITSGGQGGMVVSKDKSLIELTFVICPLLLTILVQHYF